MDDQTGKERLYHQEVLKVVANSERSERHERLKKDEDMARKAIVDERLNDRLLRLIEEHKDQDGKIKDWSNIMAQLNTEGFRNSKGQPWNRPAIQNYYQRLKNEGLVESAELVAGTQKPEGIVESPQQDEPKVPYLTEHSERYEGLSRSQLVALESLIRQVCGEMLISFKEEIMKEAVHTTPTVPTAKTIEEDEPPLPTASVTGRKNKQNRDYGKLSLTVDTVLLDLFNREAKTRRISGGRLLDIILWRYYGRPRLSYQPDQKGEEEVQAIS